MTPRQFGPYELEALVGVGGMGEVWRARDTRRDRLVAIKLLPESLAHDAEFTTRFRRESELAARLREPHVIPIHDYGEIDGRLYIDMRLVDGRDLGDILAEGPLPPERAIALLSQVADALESAHADGLVHRDVKPSNVLVTKNDFVYVVDFGIARQVGHTRTSLTITGATVGTLDYMAPERFTSAPIDGRVDVYSMACVLAECLTATRPFPGGDLPALLYAHLYADPPRPSELVAGVPPALDAVIAKGMAKRPEDRYASPCEFIGAAREAVGATASSLAATRPPTPAPVAAAPAPAPVPAPAPPVAEPVRIPREALPPPPAPAGVGVLSADGSHSSADPLLPPGPVVGPRGPLPPGGGSHPVGPLPPGGPGRPGSAAGRRRRWPLLVGVLVLLVAAGVLTAFLWPRDEGGSGGETAAPTTGAPAEGSGSISEGPPSTVPSAPAPADSIAVPTVNGEPIDVGETPGYMAVAPNGRYAYVANRGAGVVTVFDTTLNTVTGTIPIEAGPPQFITFSPDGSVAYVTVTNEDYTENYVVFVETASNTVTDTVEVGLRPFAPETSPDGRLLYVPLHNEGRVEVLDTETAQEIASYEVAPNPHWIAISDDGRTGYTANHESGVVSVLDLTDDGRVIAEVPVGLAPHSIAVSPDQTQVSVVNFDSNEVSVIDTATNAVVATIPVGARPQDISYAPDGRHFYTADVDSGTVSVVDTTTGRVTATIPTGGSPTSVAVRPDGRQAYVTDLDSGTVRVLDLAAV
ncbi:protein kinase [Blastococcus sp. SYSU D00669]